MSHIFDISSTYKDWVELLLAGLCFLSFLCAARLTHILRLSRDAARTQAKLARSMDISMDNLLYNSADYALTEFVLFMSISDMLRAIFLFSRHLRLAFNIYYICDLHNFSGMFCLAEDFILWTLISNDIICYGVICFCLFRYLRKRSIFTTHSITPKRIDCGIISLSIVQSAMQLILVIIFSDFTFTYEVIYIPSLIVLYSTVLYIMCVFFYIRCCHPFWVLGKARKHRQYIFLIVFTVIYIAPITIKMILALIEPDRISKGILSLIADILLTQTGTGNFCAWYFSQRGVLQYMQSDGNIINGSSSSVEMSTSEDFINVMKLKHSEENGRKTMKIFSVRHDIVSPSSDAMYSHYKPPSMDVNDVMRLEPVGLLSTTSDFDPMGKTSTSETSKDLSHMIYVDSTRNLDLFTKPENIMSHIYNEYGGNIDSKAKD